MSIMDRTTEHKLYIVPFVEPIHVVWPTWCWQIFVHNWSTKRVISRRVISLKWVIARRVIGLMLTICVRNWHTCTETSGRTEFTCTDYRDASNWTTDMHSAIGTLVLLNPHAKIKVQTVLTCVYFNFLIQKPLLHISLLPLTADAKC